MRVTRFGWKAGAVALCVIVAGLAAAWLPRICRRAPQVHGAIQFQDVADRTGIAFIHYDGSSGERYIVETVTAGLALFDYDNDGDEDVYLLTGAPLRGSQVDGVPQNALYRNDGGWQFANVTESAGIGDPGFGLGVAAADYDNDGDQDLYVNNYGPNVLYRNNGDGTFADATEEAGVGCGHKVGAGACFLDVDGDGDLDLYVANYVQFTYENHVVHWNDGHPSYVGPRAYDAEPDVLYRNNGDGTFTDISDESGIGRHAGSGMGLVACDHDRDGDSDVFVLNDVAGNFFFENDGTGKFQEVGLTSGAAYNVYGDELGSMGIDCGDYDNDGWLDFLMTSYQGELPVLYKNLRNGVFEDVTISVGAGDGSFAYVNWGAGLIDFDNDGDRDVFMACGHLQDNIHLYDDSTSYRVRNIVLMNTGDGRFANVSDSCGDGLLAELSSRGTGFDDLDGDGDVDAVVLNSRDKPTILENRSPTDAHWIGLRLCGVTTNRDGVGAQVRVVAGDLLQVDEVHSGRGYQSHHGMRLHFGLGDRERVDRVEVRWIGGGIDEVEHVAVDQVLTIIEGAAQE